MHPEAFSYVQNFYQEFYSFYPKKVVEFGSRDTNGSIRQIFINDLSNEIHEYLGIDKLSGRGVDLVCDILDWNPDQKYDCVVCCEVLEHMSQSDQFLTVTKAKKALRRDGIFIATMAIEPRKPHSAYDGGPLRDGEPYENVKTHWLKQTLWNLGFELISYETHKDRGDFYVSARLEEPE